MLVSLLVEAVECVEVRDGAARGAHGEREAPHERVQGCRRCDAIKEGRGWTRSYLAATVEELAPERHELQPGSDGHGGADVRGREETAIGGEGVQARPPPHCFRSRNL